MTYNGELTACPLGPIPANNWTLWIGAVPPQLTAFAVSSLKTESEHPYGYEWTTTYDGQQVLAIKQHHTWTYNTGKFVTGICIPGITLYRPKKIGVQEVDTDLSVPNADIAWFDAGQDYLRPTSWKMVTECAIVILLLIALFYFGLKIAKKS